jgi:hypothetical protein
VTPSGPVLGQVSLSPSANYVVTAGVTALSSVTDSMQCQLGASTSSSWDDMGETDVTGRVTVPLEHAYPRTNGLTQYTVTVACRSAAENYVVDTGHIYVWQVGSISSPGSHVLYRVGRSDLSWAPMGK